MAVDAHDVKICLWKMLKLCSKTCMDASINHPYISSSMFFSFLLYIFFPLVFWILVYSTPLVVCSCIALTTLRKPREAEGDPKSDQNYNTRKKAKFASERVHSVRRRRAKEILMENEPGKQNSLPQQDEFMMELETELAKQNALLQQDEFMTEFDLPKQNVLLQQEEEKEEKKVISSTSYDDCVEKSPLLVEEIPKEIREVEQVRSPSQTPTKHEETTNEDDHKHNAMDIGISDTERTKRLESLIARRRSRKMLSHQVRALMNMDRNNHHNTATQMPSIIIPKINTYSPNKLSGAFSPGPGSAPSILIPMRNPFDLPYDPQEEKPILTGDSFHQEFTLNTNCRDMMFSRHESFSYGPSATSSGRDFGFRYRFSRPETEFAEMKFAPIMEQIESKSSMNSPDEDQIKEIIQVDENESEEEEEYNGESESRQIPESDFNTSSSSPSSSSEDEPVFKIDREAVLKSLSSMRRNALLEIENSEDAIGNNLSYANSALENATRLKQQYYDDNRSMKCHGISYSIASDMQVEVSEVSSPPLTIDDGEDLTNASVSRIDTTEDDSLSDTTMGDDQANVDPDHQLHVESNEHQLQSSNISPKSVLIPTLSLTNLDQVTTQEAAPHIPESSHASPDSVNHELKTSENMDQLDEIVTSSADHDEETGSTSNQNAFNKSIYQSEDEMVIRESTLDDERQTNPTSSNCFDETKHVQDYDLSKPLEGNETSGADHRDDEHQSAPHNASPESINEEPKNQENVDQLKGVAISSADHEEETSSRSTDAASTNDSEATSNRNASNKSIDQSEDQMVIRESTHDDETKQVQDKEMNETDHREDEECANSQWAVLPESINSIDNDKK